jgi:hypothetical protein
LKTVEEPKKNPNIMPWNWAKFVWG